MKSMHFGLYPKDQMADPMLGVQEHAIRFPSKFFFFLIQNSGSRWFVM